MLVCILESVAALSASLLATFLTNFKLTDDRVLCVFSRCFFHGGGISNIGDNCVRILYQIVFISLSL
jgi:hypothetical protein